MSNPQRPATKKEATFVGAIGAAVGLIMILMWLGVIPFKPGPRDGPLWILAAAGIAFMLAGLSIVLHAAAGGQSGADLPPKAPRWVPIAQYLLAMTAVICLALIGTWVAFGPGARSFNISFGLIQSNGGNELIGRAVFGVGTLLTWLAVIAFGVAGARKLHRRLSAQPE